MTIEEFIEKCQKRPIPSGEIAKASLFARELAEGIDEGFWRTKLDIYYRDSRENKLETHHHTTNTNYLMNYFDARWKESIPNFETLVTLGLASYYKYFSEKGIEITDSALALLDEAIEASVFISYKRSESSAFALLINNTLKQHGIEPFIDMQLQAGDDWHAELEQYIKKSDYFIVMLGQQTLESTVTIKEIQWALEAGVTLIPIWHNGFTFEGDQWHALPDGVGDALGSTHTIRVLEENPLTYDTALRELLNRFGIST